MPPGSRRPSKSSSLSSPVSPTAPSPKAIDYGLPITQAMEDIRRSGTRLTFNRCQFKRIESMCFHIYGKRDRRERESMERLLRSIHARCTTWTSAPILQNLTEIPGEMDEFERQCAAQGAPRGPELNSRSELVAERAALVSAIKKIISNERHRAQAMKLRGEPAIVFVSHLQSILDESPFMAPTLREEFIKALRKLANEAEVLPRTLEIDEVFLDQHLATGGFGEVYKGTWQGKPVAVKMLRIFKGKDNTDTFKAFRREVLLWRQLSHQFVLPLLGIFKSEDNPIHSMVSEWMPNGTLKSFLTQPQHQESNRLKLLYEITLALQYLHTHRPPVAHGDIKADNIFVDAEMRPLLGDFGLSCNHYNIDRTISSTLIGGSVRWMAQELLYPTSKSDDKSDTGHLEKPTPESDIWSLGMLILEVFTDAEPYNGDGDPVVIINVTQGRLPVRPDEHITERGLTDDVWHLMNRCWKHKPSERAKIDYIIESLKGLSQDVKPTAWTERRVTVQVPTTLVQRIVDLDEANLKLLNVPVTKRPGSKMKDAKITDFWITGNAYQVHEARNRITGKIKEMGGTSQTVTDHVHIPKLLHGPIIGQGGHNVKRISSKHGVKIHFPNRNSLSDQVAIKGPRRLGVDGAKEDLQKSMEFEQRWRDEIKIETTPQAAKVVQESRAKFKSLGLKEVFVNVESGIVTLRGQRSGITSAQVLIRSIEAQTIKEITVNVPIDSFFHEMIKDDPQVWADMVDRCDGPSEPDKQRRLLDTISDDLLCIRGTPELAESLCKEVKELMAVGHACVTAKRISAHRQKSLIGHRGELLKTLRAHSGAMAYFPTSGGYAAVGMPNNMADYENIPAEEIVKLVGSSVACAKGRRYLEEQITEQKREEREERDHNWSFEFPAELHHVVKRKAEPRLRTLGILISDTGAPVVSPSLLRYASELETRRGDGWEIFERHDMTEQCQWHLKAKSSDALVQGRSFLEKEVRASIEAHRRIGILHLEDSYIPIVQENINDLQQDKEILLEIEHPDRVVLAGASTDAVEKAINKVIGLFEGLQ